MKRCYLVYILITVLTCGLYWMLVGIIDAFLLGSLHFKKSERKETKAKIIIDKKNRIDKQAGLKCSAFASAYILRHFNIEADGESLYEKMPHKMKSGCVYPKGIRDLLRGYNLSVRYCRGNLVTLKEALNEGNPLIAMILVKEDKPYLHYVAITGYEAKYLYIADSLFDSPSEDKTNYNRLIDNDEFLRLWNTASFIQPLYKNTYFVVKMK